jgi:hypothetical protein
VRCAWMVVCVAVVGCSNGRAGSRPLSMSSSALPDTSSSPHEREVIPAEWTVSEDTSATGEITTASLQLPAAKEIHGLAGEQSPRLILRCLDGRVAAFIAPESTDTDVQSDSLPVTPDLVRVDLDSAPSCE